MMLLDKLLFPFLYMPRPSYAQEMGKSTKKSTKNSGKNKKDAQQGAEPKDSTNTDTSSSTTASADGEQKEEKGKKTTPEPSEYSPEAIEAKLAAHEQNKAWEAEEQALADAQKLTEKELDDKYKYGDHPTKKDYETGGPIYSSAEVEPTTQKTTRYQFYDDINPLENVRAHTPLQFDLPDWGVEDYINERSNWIKGKGAATNEAGWFYFKVFFKFNTNFGLFGGMLHEPGMRTYSGNTAKRFLNEICYGYPSERPYDRLLALDKFCKMFSTINRECPWLIKKVNNVGSTFKRLTEQEDTEADRKIELVFNLETVDFKILNLLHLYRYICYDDINMKNILPSNLRKFDMSIVFYQVPIKFFQTAIMTANKDDFETTMKKWLPEKTMEKIGSTVAIVQSTFNFLTSQSKYFEYKRMHTNQGDFTNMMSFHMITLQDCEFDVSTFDSYFNSGDITVEEAYQVNEATIGINYGRAYHHTMNEWNQFMFGSDGFHFNIAESNQGLKIGKAQNNLHKKRLNALLEGYNSTSFYDASVAQYRSIIDYSEDLVNYGLMSMSMKDYYKLEKGNIYGDISTNSDFFNYKNSLYAGVGYLGNIFGTSIDTKPKVYTVTEMTKDRYDYYSSGDLGNIYADFYKKSSPDLDNSSSSSNSASDKMKDKLGKMTGDIPAPKSLYDLVSQKYATFSGPNFHKKKTALEWLEEHRKSKIQGLDEMGRLLGSFWQTDFSSFFGGAFKKK